MSLRSLVIPALLGSSLATSAFAGGLADPVTPAPLALPPAAPVTGEWTGFYLGGQYGTGHLEEVPNGVDENGAIYGLHAGYMYDFGDWVLGGEVDYDWTEIVDEGAIDGALDYIARVKLRVGYDLGDALPYFTAGMAQAQFSDPGIPTIVDTGYFYGLGLAYKVRPNVLVGGEYLRHEFDDFDGTGLSPTIDTFTLRASYTF